VPEDRDTLHFVGVSLDCADPAALAAFYLDLLGGELLWQNADSAGVRVPGVTLVAQRVTPYVPPVWPGASVVHLDLSAGSDVDEHGQAELGYRILRRYWHNGLASDGARELIRHGCENLELRRIFAETMPVNAGSRVTMTAVGMQHVRTSTLTGKSPSRAVNLAR